MVDVHRFDSLNNSIRVTNDLALKNNTKIFHFLNKKMNIINL